MTDLNTDTEAAITDEIDIGFIPCFAPVHSYVFSLCYRQLNLK
jgi:hypothetical protein